MLFSPPQLENSAVCVDEMYPPLSEAAPSASQRNAAATEKDGFEYGYTVMFVVYVPVRSRASVTPTVTGTVPDVLMIAVWYGDVSVLTPPIWM